MFVATVDLLLNATPERPNYNFRIYHNVFGSGDEPMALGYKLLRIISNRGKREQFQQINVNLPFFFSSTIVIFCLYNNIK